MKKTIVIQNNSFQIDIGFIIILLVLMFTSCFALYNAFNLITDGSGTSYLMKQILWYIIGFVVMFFLNSLNNKVIYYYVNKARQILMYCLGYLLASRFSLSLIGYTLPFAPSINGAVSWLSFPLIGSFQPSEFIKIVLIVQVAQKMRVHQEKYPDPTFQDDLNLIKEIIKIVILPMIFIFIQPDTGVCIIIGFTILVMFMCSGIRKEYVRALIILVVVAIVGFLYLYTYHEDFLSSLISSYRLQRIEAWLDPESHILGSSNQLYTALLSLGSAGLTGYGLQANIIAIPEAHTDFIFAAIGQCFGLVGTTAIVILCLILDLYLCRIAIHVKDKQDRFIAIGVIAMLLYQQLQNLGMIVGIFPITGITLPLISYGGSSIVSYFISFSIIMNISPLEPIKKVKVKNRSKRRLKKLKTNESPA